MFSSPALLLGSTVATLWATLFHLLAGRKWQELILYWFAGLVGFAIGQAVGDALPWSPLMLGQVHLLEGTVGCWAAMGIARCLRLC